MAARRDSRGRWRYRKMLLLPNGTKRRISGTPAVDKRWAAEKAEEDHITRLLESARRSKVRKEAPTFEEWFLGRYMVEWCEAQKNKPGTVVEKKSIFEHHLKGTVGSMRLDEIDVGVVQELKASLGQRPNRYKKQLSLKTLNNVLAVLSNAMRYAEEVGLIEEAPRIRQYKFERPEIECLEFTEWQRMLAAAAAEGLSVAVQIAGDAGLRLGEVLAVQWEDIDLVAGRITVSRQLRKGVEGTPKGGRRRSVPITPALLAALKGLPQVRRGRVVCAADGKPVAEAALKHRIYRVCRKAGLPERGWHALRHTFATHAAQFGVNPWRLQAWLGHSSINMTMRYVHHADEHRRPIPDHVLEAGTGTLDPDVRVIAMLGARSDVVRGNTVATAPLAVV